MDLYSRGHYLNNKFQSHQYFTGCYWLALTTKKSSGLLSQMQKCMLRTSKFSCTNSRSPLNNTKGFARVTQTNGSETGMDPTNHKTSPLTLQPFLLSCSLNISQFFFIFFPETFQQVPINNIFTACASHRITEWMSWDETSGDPHPPLWRSSSPTTSSEQGHMYHGCVQLDFEYLQGWRLQNFSRQPVSLFDYTYSKEKKWVLMFK